MRSIKRLGGVVEAVRLARLVAEQGHGRPGGYHFVAVMDDGTCPVCARYHCKVYPVGSAPQPPLHPNCRCYLEPVWELEPIPGFRDALQVTVRLDMNGLPVCARNQKVEEYDGKSE
ncbi:MAG: phage minor head protein [Candidatus Bathyarchaeota archaeon]|nr:phage minor head protein [Candidatus Bathyarchaeota archaeon]